MNDWLNEYSNICHEYCCGLPPEIPVFSVFRYNHCDKQGMWRTWFLSGETLKATCIEICDDKSSELEWLGWEETFRCDLEEFYPFLDITTVMSWWQEAEHTAWLDAKHLGSKPSRRVTQIKGKLTADSSHAYYVHPDSHGDADIMCILNSQIPLCSVPDVWCYINTRVMFWTEHLLAYADVQKKSY